MNNSPEKVLFLISFLFAINVKLVTEYIAPALRALGKNSGEGTEPQYNYFD